MNKKVLTEFDTSIVGTNRFMSDADFARHTEQARQRFHDTQCGGCCNCIGYHEGMVVCVWSQLAYVKPKPIKTDDGSDAPVCVDRE